MPKTACHCLNICIAALSCASQLDVRCRQDLQMRLLSLFVDFALSPLAGKEILDLGALLPAIAEVSHSLPPVHAVGRKTHSNSFDMLQVLQEDDANRIKVWHCCRSTSLMLRASCRKFGHLLIHIIRLVISQLRSCDLMPAVDESLSFCSIRQQQCRVFRKVAW